MGSITILLGRSRWRRRRALPDQAWSGVDGFGRPTFLYVAPTTAKRRVVEREFVERRKQEPCFSPDVRVLDELLDELWLRHGDGRALLPRRALQHVAARVLASNQDHWPWLAQLGRGPAVAGALVDLRDALDGANRLHRSGGGLPSDVPHSAELTAALAALETRLRQLPGHVARTTALHRLLHRVQEPSRALVRQLRAARTVVFDDILQPSPLVRAVLIALTRAWASVGTHVVLSLETGRDLGGREVGAFFEYDDVDDVAYALRPFKATRALRRSLFEELVASGEATLMFAGREGQVEIEPGAPLADPAPADLSDHLYGPRPLHIDGVPVTTTDQARGLLADTLALTAWPDAATELAGVAASVKQALLDGVDARDCRVAVPGLRERAPQVSAVFAAAGVPIRIDRPGPLAGHPIAAVAVKVATAAAQGFPVEDVLGLACSDLVETPEGAPLLALSRLCRRAAVPDGLPRSWSGAIHQAIDRSPGHVRRQRVALMDALEVMDGLVRPLEALGRPMAPRVWREQLLRQLRRLRVAERAATGERPGDTLDAWGSLVELIDELVRDMEIAGAEDLDPLELAEAFEHAVRRTPLPSPPRRPHHVEVIDLDDVVGLTPRNLWVLGLTRDAWPGAPGPSFLVPERVLHQLEVPRRADAARYLFASLLRNAVDDREIERLHLSWHVVSDGRATTPSALVQDLLALPTRIPDPRGRAPHLLLGDALDLSPPEVAPSSSRDVLALAARQPAWRPHAPAALHPQLALQASVHRERTGPVPGAWEGVFERPWADVPDTLGVTALETFLRCPARFWYERQLHLDPGDPVEPDVPRIRSGSALHAILEDFLRPRLDQPIAGEPQALAAELHDVARSHLDALQREGGFSVTLLDHLRDEWLAGLVDDRPHGVLRAWLEAELEAGRTPVSVEDKHSLDLGALTLEARLDRVDRVGPSRLVIDYKSGSAPSGKDVLAGLSLQPVAYAASQAALAPGAPVAATFLTLRRADDVRTRGWVGEAAALDAASAPRRGTITLTPEERDALLDHARDGATRLRRGLAHTTLATEKQARCDHCAMRRVCRLDGDRAAVLAASGADLQRPRDPEADLGDSDDDTGHDESVEGGREGAP